MFFVVHIFPSGWKRDITNKCAIVPQRNFISEKHIMLTQTLSYVYKKVVLKSERHIENVLSLISWSWGDRTGSTKMILCYSLSCIHAWCINIIRKTFKNQNCHIINQYHQIRKTATKLKSNTFVYVLKRDVARFENNWVLLSKQAVK